MLTFQICLETHTSTQQHGALIFLLLDRTTVQSKISKFYQQMNYKIRGLSPQANYIDRPAAAGRRS